MIPLLHLEAQRGGVGHFQAPGGAVVLDHVLPAVEGEDRSGGWDGHRQLSCLSGSPATNRLPTQISKKSDSSVRPNRQRGTRPRCGENLATASPPSLLIGTPVQRPPFLLLL